MADVIVIGGGAAGMMAAAGAAENGASVVLLEKNEKLGKKMLITGKGRCNLTNNTDIQGLLQNTVSNPRFLNSAFRAFTPQDTIDYFEGLGVPLKTERGNRVFPQSDKSFDINNALVRHLERLGVQIKLNAAVQKIEYIDGSFHATNHTAKALIIATGGLSYPATGSTGDGYNFAKAFNHTIIPTFPSLVALTTQETWVSALEGLTLKNIAVTAKDGAGKTLYKDLGELLFTQKGVTGPLILTAAAYLADKLTPPPKITIDLKPALTNEQLDSRILRDFKAYQNKDFANALADLLPKRLTETIITLSAIPPQKKVNEITRAERGRLVDLLKGLELTVVGTNGYKEAVITKGGVNTKEINPKNLMSKLQQNLFFAGEVIDVDALTGGYNLQIAFSTGFLAGKSAAAEQVL